MYPSRHALLPQLDVEEFLILWIIPLWFVEQPPHHSYFLQVALSGKHSVLSPNRWRHDAKQPPTWVVPSNTIDKCLPLISLLSWVISSWSIKGTSCLRFVEFVRGNPWSSSDSQKLSILLSRTPAFNIAVTTFIRYTRVELGNVLSAGWCWWSNCLRASRMFISRWLFWANLCLPRSCFWDFMCNSMMLFLVANSSQQVEQNGFYCSLQWNVH